MIIFIIILIQENLITENIGLDIQGQNLLNGQWTLKIKPPG